jgi:enoyl-[acyl-carrier-protein] reductase (NADH)
MVSMFDFSARPLAGKKGVILGIANEHSIAYGCAQAFRGLGADAVAATGKLNADAQRRLRLAADPAALHLDEGIVGRGKARTDQSRRV